MEEGWWEGTGPYNPAIIDGFLYGRGSADDGYAFFGTVLMAKTLKTLKTSMPSMTLIFESDEESGSKDIVYFMEKNKKLFPEPNLVFCLDSGCLDYKHIFLTQSLWGICNFELKVQILKEGVHSGNGSGYVADSFRIIRKLIDEFEDVNTGRLPEELYVNIPEDKYASAIWLFES